MFKSENDEYSGVCLASKCKSKAKKLVYSFESNDKDR